MSQPFERRRVDYSRTIEGTEDDPVRPCCEQARGGVVNVLPSMRFDADGRLVECGYALEPMDSPCACPAAWMVYDWRAGHAKFTVRPKPTEQADTQT
jgi:hypothetical protein